MLAVRYGGNMDKQPMAMHNTFWRENQVIVTFHSDTQLISADEINNAATILKRLSLESQLQKLNQFLKDGGINFTLSFFGDEDKPPRPPVSQPSSSNEEQKGTQFIVPPGVYLFGWSKPIAPDFGQVQARGIPFFTLQADATSTS